MVLFMKQKSKQESVNFILYCMCIIVTVLSKKRETETCYNIRLKRQDKGEKIYRIGFTKLTAM